MLVLGCADTAFEEMTKTILKGISPDTGDSSIYRSSSSFGLTVLQLLRLSGPTFMP